MSIPVSVLKAVEKLCRIFLWHGQEDSKSFKLVSWQKVCVPRSEGGLGIKQLRAWNSAALGKHLWTILTKPASLWSKWIHINYLKGTSLWDYKPPNDCSWAISKLFQLRDAYRMSFRVEIGDGRETLLFYDWWCGQQRIIDLEDIGAHTENHWRAIKVSDWRVNGAWRIPSSFARKWPNANQLICAQQVNNGCDKVIWVHCKSGNFSISSAYEFLRHKERRVEGNPRHYLVNNSFFGYSSGIA